LPVPEEVANCPEHGPRKQIGEDRTETLEFQRPKLRIRVTVIPKFACEHEPCCGVKEPERPLGLVEGNRYDTSIAAEILAAKYFYHLPIYRQQDWFAGCGWTPGRSTLLNISGSDGLRPGPLADHYRRLVSAARPQAGRFDGDAPAAAGDSRRRPAIRVRSGFTRCSARLVRKAVRASRRGCGPTGRWRFPSTYSTSP
jgi:transposase